jgi:ankyrin repeat protein
MASGLEAEESPLLSRFGENQQQNPSLDNQFESKTEELIAAIQEKDLQKTKQLVKAGANVNAIVCKCLHQNRYRDGDHIGFPLYWAAVTGWEYTKFLLDAGALINLVFLPLGTALGGAVYHGDFETVELLVNYGADVNTPGRGDSMPLEAATSTERESAVKAQFLSNNRATANRDSMDWDRDSIDWDRDSIDWDRDSIDWDQYLVNSRGSSTVQRAIKMDIDVNTVRENRTPLIGCVESLDLEGARILLEAGANPNLVIVDATTARVTVAPIMTAMASGNTKLVLMLLRHGADMKIARKHWDSWPVALETYSNVSDVLADLIAEKATGLVRSIKSEWEIPRLSPGSLPTSEPNASHNLSHYVTLIATGNRMDGNHKGLNIEATTCGEYAGRNWGKEGTLLLTDIESGLKGTN